jgi:hypothetical protein
MALCQSCENWYKLKYGWGWEDEVAPDAHCHHGEEEEKQNKDVENKVAI